ncbi:hypothetical protein ACIA8O_16745 [Kitasatospora sp. NPDC051853]|uniref:hypothetical protein n=1 Tax=Kitasatospora sp. NPDC051853 TaxID=3364058 RepID=UPI0037981620
MIWWMRVRCVPAVVVGLLVCGALGMAADSVTVPIPVVVGGLTFDLPLPSVLPVLPVCLILQGQERARRELEEVAVRAVGRWDAALMATAVAVSALAAAVASAAGGGTAAVALARDFAGYLGFALLIRYLAGAYLASAAVAVLPFACASFGLTHNRPGVWAWPLHEPSSVTAGAQALLLLVAGAVTLALPPVRHHRGGGAD